MTVLNAIMAKTLVNFKQEVDALIEKGEKKEVAIMETLKQYIVTSEKVLFEGDGYSEEWHQEAERRGLPNIPTTPPALDAYLTPKSKELFESLGIYNHAELEARHEIMLEDYIKRVQIESRIMGELCTSHILPSAIKYQNLLIENIRGLKELGLMGDAFSNQVQILQKISRHIAEVSEHVEKMIEARKKANALTDTRKKAIAYCDDVKGKYFEKIRYHVDKLELLVDDQYWLLPKYREMLFLR
jgi:glutamine synthetase